MAKTTNVDAAAIRAGLMRLPRASSHHPGDPVSVDDIQIVPGHRAALDPDRALVVGNRGVGKSFWTHALADAKARALVARSFPELNGVDVVIGFNATEQSDLVAPSKNAIDQALNDHRDPEAIWRAVLVRVARSRDIGSGAAWPSRSFVEQVRWVREHAEDVDALVTELDHELSRRRRKLVVVFDALDRLGTDWQTKRDLTTALLRRALAVRSFRAIRVKLFMRQDQFEDPQLFRFADGSKLANERVVLAWEPSELFELVLARLRRDRDASAPLARIVEDLERGAGSMKQDLQRRTINAIAGEFMGADKKRGRVYTWLPLHLSDARGQSSPRTFLTAWREAARWHEARPPGSSRLAVDHLGLHEGVRKASQDRLAELQEDYWWIPEALAPLGGEQVPMDRSRLRAIWQQARTTKTIRDRSGGSALPPIRLDAAVAIREDPEDALLADLVAIAVVEERPNDKINVPDIFRLEARIKRKGGVPAPQRGNRG